ncbi:MAG: Serine--tRNA ligase, partial [Alphaproteobacteria bacterium MarineAlpha2_Bin1]
MHDINKIRENPLEFDSGLIKRGESVQSSNIIKIDDKRKSIQTKLQEAQNLRNLISRDIGNAINQNNHDRVKKLKNEVQKYKIEIQDLEKFEKETVIKLKECLSIIPNIPSEDVPDGISEEDNLKIRDWGKFNNFDFDIKDHVELGQKLNLMDFQKTSEISGSRFVTLKGELALLERSLGAFMLDVHTKQNNYLEISPPILVKDEAPYGVGQLPKFEGDLFKTTSGHWLISTGEVPLTNLHRDEVVNVDKFPIRYVALTPCFRSEAGAAGKDTRGMLRMHQFYKVEIVSFVNPENGYSEHNKLTNCAEDILKQLKLPYRVMSLCAGDLGFSSCKTFDLEVWLPSQNKYREISSCSYFGDFQSRRMNTRYLDKNKKYQFVHTINGSGLAIGRTLVAIMENYQQKDGSIVIPDVLV